MSTKPNTSQITYDTGSNKQDLNNILDTIVPIADYTALRNYTGRVTQVRITAEGIAGLFKLTGITTTTTEDNGGTVICASSIGAKKWERVFDDIISATWFQADKTGVLNSVSAINALISYANTLTQPVTLDFPSGTYKVTNGVTQAIERGYVRIKCNNSKFICESGKVFNFSKTNTSLYRIEVTGANFEYPELTGSPATPVDVNAIPVNVLQGFYFSIKDCFVRNAPAVVALSNCANYAINGLYGNTINVAKPAILLDTCVVGYLDNISLYNRVELQPQNPTESYPLPPVNENVFIKVQGSTDTPRFGDSVLSNRYHRGLVMQCEPGQQIGNVYSDSLVVDYCYDRGIYILNNGGSVANINFNDAYIQAMNGIGVDVNHNSASGLTQGVKFFNPKILLSGSMSMRFMSQSTVLVYDCTVKNPTIAGGNRLGAGGYDIYALRARVNVEGGEVGQPSSLAGATYACQATYGIYFDACDVYSVTGVRSGGTVGSFQFLNNAGTAYRQRLVADNRVMSSYSALDRPEYVQPTVASVVSPDTYTNTTAYKQRVNIYSLTTPGAATITVNGVTCSNWTEFSTTLSPGDTMITTTAIGCNRRIMPFA